MKVIGELIDRTLSAIGDEASERKIAAEVKELTGKFPFYL